MIKRLEPDPNLDDLVRELNASAREPEPAGPVQPIAQSSTERSWSVPRVDEEGVGWLRELLSRARKQGASDLLLVVGAPPTMRIHGRLERLGEKALSEGATALLCGALTPDSRRATLESRAAADFSINETGLGRFRCNVHRARDAWAAAVRVFPDAAPDLESLNLPPSLERFGELTYGLVLVTGPTGCGKSTTIAALVRQILERRRVHLITIEDPVEYEHEHTDSVIEHIEIGRDVPDFAQALRAAMRQDPDVLLIGEMRDSQSMSIAITAAETGHLVLSTLHTADAPQTVFRILDTYPANQMDAVRSQLSASLAGIVSQQLLPRADGQGRAPAVEILIATHAVRNLIRRGRIEQLRTQLTLEQQAGMLDLDHSLARLVRAGLVEPEEAQSRARAPEEFAQLLGSGKR